LKRSDIILSGIPVIDKQDNPMGLADGLLRVLEVPLEPWELIGCHRLSKWRNGDTPIIVRFNRPEVRD